MEVMERGRWKSVESVKRYNKPARINQQLALLGDQLKLIMDGARQFERDFTRKIGDLLSTVVRDKSSSSSSQDLVTTPRL